MYMKPKSCICVIFVDLNRPVVNEGSGGGLLPPIFLLKLTFYQLTIIVKKKARKIKMTSNYLKTTGKIVHFM